MAGKDRKIDWDVDEFHLACSMLDAAPDGVQVIDLGGWRREDDTFDRQTRKMVQRVREARKNG
jgi:hypothetical protein